MYDSMRAVTIRAVEAESARVAGVPPNGLSGGEYLVRMLERSTRQPRARSSGETSVRGVGSEMRRTIWQMKLAPAVESSLATSA